MKIATLNINSINARLELLTDWLRTASPDVVFLQEIKTTADNFPFLELQMAGYHAEIVGQKSYNGVAVLSKEKTKVVSTTLEGFDISQARYLEVELSSKISLASVYMPNGNPKTSDKFQNKLSFMNAFNKHAKKLLLEKEYVVFGGDFNVILKDSDVYQPELFKNNALTDETARNHLTALEYMGFYDAYRMLHTDSGYTFWNYTARAFEADFGMRIDYLFLSPKMADLLQECFVEKSLRAAEKPSDHAPLVALFDM